MFACVVHLFSADDLFSKSVRQGGEGREQFTKKCTILSCKREKKKRRKETEKKRQEKEKKDYVLGSPT